MTIGTRIRTLRTEKAYSQEYLAEKMDVSRQAVSKWENDISSPDTNNLVRLADLFGVSVEYLATGKVAPGGESGENTENVCAVLKRVALIFFLAAFVFYCVGFFTGEFTKSLRLLPFLWYGTSVWAIILSAASALFTIVWICLLIAAGSLNRKRRN